MCAHTHVLPPPKVFNLSLKADWDRTANPSLISEWQALLFSASPSSYWKSGWLALFRWCDSDVFWSKFRTKYPFIHHQQSFARAACDCKEPDKEGLGTCVETRICTLLDLLYTEDRKKRCSEFGPNETSFFRRYNPTVISKETALFGLQQTQSLSLVPVCHVSNHIFMTLPP